ncbi:hypothetical protein A7U60_g8783 [Sanghuangporus baumii]|uniref:Uncharacterized protein n=1 Tax=Sanghuangporus baumii TaxID=108892 RepID=A0A9Q5HQJ0_SANBA|nr:hypothetical protein A7U60_g8783 [Sanghuangporus baumii]
MNGFAEHISAPKISNATKHYHAENRAARNSRQSREFIPREPSPDKDYYPAIPPKHIRAKHSYRNSYPQSKREMKEWIVASESFNGDDNCQSTSPGPSIPIDNTTTRPRRSSLRQPGRSHRRNSAPPKHVHFSSADIIYEPFDSRDSQTIEQILDMLKMPSRSIPSIPPESSYSVVVRHTDAAHDYPKPVSPARSFMETVNSVQTELVGDAGRPRYSRNHSIDHPKQTLGRSSPHRDGQYEEEFRADVQSPLRYTKRDVRSELMSAPRAGQASKRHSIPHYETHSQRQAHARMESYSRPRGNSVPQPRSNRSSLESEATLVNAEQAWAPAKVILKNEESYHPEEVDVNEPVVYAPKDGNMLRRSDAQRLPSVTRRHKLLQNIARMWG